MTEQKNIIWERAGKAGLVLGGVSIAYMLLTMLVGKVAGEGSPFLTGAIGAILWLAKFVGCILLMRLFIQRFAAAEPEADRNRVFRFGMLTALLSAVLYSGFYLAYVSFIAPDTFSQALDMLADNPMLGSNSMSEIEDMIPRMPTISFFANLVYCWLFGTILSAIFSASARPQNPFADNQADKQ